MSRFTINEDIRRASTLPSDVYSDPALYRLQIDHVFARTWHVIAAARDLDDPGVAHPATLLEGSLDEPVLLTRDGSGGLHALSNVCTHRGNILVSEHCNVSSIRCRYHG